MNEKMDTDWIKYVGLRKGLLPMQCVFFCFNFGNTPHRSFNPIDKDVNSCIFPAFSLMFPFLSPMMRNLGLTNEDVSLIIGSTPVVTFFSTPILALLADRIGYKVNSQY